MHLINIVKAAESNIVSCTGADCEVCSLLETISNVYNFFLAVSFAVAVLVLVIAGVNYILNTGDKSRVQKSKYFLKSGIGGFALIILGWIVIQSVIKTVGYENAGGWWEFQCGKRGTQHAVSPPGAFQSDYYTNLKTYPDIISYLKSGDKTAKISGPSDALSFTSQVKGLKDGEVLHFLAPVRVDSINGTEDLFLPLLSILKDGDNLKLQSTGEYWDLIQNMWPKLSSGEEEDSVTSLLNKLLGTDSFTDNRSLINSEGNSIDADSLSDLYDVIAGVLVGSGDRSEIGSDLTNASLSELIALAGSFEPGENASATDQMIGNLTTQVLGLVSDLVVEKGVAYDNSATAGWRCESSGGKWENETCTCVEGYVLGSDKMCHDAVELKNNCESSGGEWKDAFDGSSLTPACGSIESASDVMPIPEWQQNAERADESDISVSREFCVCKDKSCVDNDGTCLDGSRDKDGDKIANGLDVCPITPGAEKNAVNRDKNGQFYGCACSEIVESAMKCPPDQCVGDNWVDYPNATRECKNGQLAAYSCQPESRSYDEQCVELNSEGEITQGFGDNANTNSNPWATSANSPFQNSSAGQGKAGSDNKPSGSQSPGGATKSPSKPIRDDFGNWRNSDRNRVPDNNNPGQSYAGTKGVKEALKRIYQRDKLRYLMIFKYTNKIWNQGGGGAWGGAGETQGCGIYSVTFGSGVRLLDRLIIHEGTHSADFCQRTIGDIPSAEYVAVGNEIGSVGRVKESPGQREEIKVMNPAPKDGEEKLEVRGYASRIINTDIDPVGDMNTSMIGSDAGYAKGYKSESGNWVYGWLRGGSDYTLRLNDNEHNRILRMLETMDKFRCRTRPPADLPQLTEENGYKEELLQGCKPDDKNTPEIRIGN